MMLNKVLLHLMMYDVKKGITTLNDL